MANQEHLNILRRGVAVWNQWRKENPQVVPDLEGADVSQTKFNNNEFEIRLFTENKPRFVEDKSWFFAIDLSNIDLSHANLISANLNKAKLQDADLSDANLRRAELSEAYLKGANLSHANLYGNRLYGTNFTEAKLHGTSLSDSSLYGVGFNGATITNSKFDSLSYFYVSFREANISYTSFAREHLSTVDFSEAKLQEVNFAEARLIRTDLSKTILNKVDLSLSQLIETDLSEAILTDCSMYGASVWGVKLHGTTQRNLTITPRDEPAITVDNLEIAQFIYLLLNNEKIRDILDNVSSKAVLILGRFTPDRKIVLDSLRDVLRKHNYLPILFDFDKPSSRNLTETVSTLAHIAKFVIADITDAKSIPQELQRIVPQLPSLPVQPLILSSKEEYSMFKDFLDYPWVLFPYRYNSLSELLASLEDKVVAPAVAKAKEIEERRKSIEKALSK